MHIHHSRRQFILRSGTVVIGAALPLSAADQFTQGMKTIQLIQATQSMKTITHYEVIIIGGSYSGLAAAMALGRAMRRVLVIDSGMPCNRQTPQSHNFLTQDGTSPHDIAALARLQVAAYSTVEFLNDLVVHGTHTSQGFDIQTQSGMLFTAQKLIMATGIQDRMPPIIGFSECWGKSVLHCPYCHGYEVRKKRTGIIGNGDSGYEMAKLIHHWASESIIFTQGKASFTTEQWAALDRHSIQVDERKINAIEHTGGYAQSVKFVGGETMKISVLYSRLPFTQQCKLPQELGCMFTEEGYISVDAMQRTTIPGLYACGDNSSRMRTVAGAIATGTTAGMMLNKELIEEQFTTF